MVKLSLLVGEALVLALCTSLGASLECYTCDVTQMTTECTLKKENCTAGYQCGTPSSIVVGVNNPDFKNCTLKSLCGMTVSQESNGKQTKVEYKCCNTDLCNSGTKAGLPAVSFLLPLFLCVGLLH
nr:PREDICTED: prostate stem cell antigen-like [Latimeria chalumnae]|eukprot:XP_006013543.1 PREDICTED: prostate stem cell antigen-like [Latimeria chalumnae]